MFKTKFIISTTLILIFLIITSVVKNKTRIIEKQISNLSKKTLSKRKDLNETQLDFYYLTSPAELEKKLSIIGLDNYQPIEYSKMFFEISDFKKIQSKISKLKSKWKKN